MKNRIVLVGYYGYDNLGDDIMLFSFLQEMLNDFPKVEISVLSKYSKNLERMCESFDNVKLKCFKQNSPIFNLILYLKAIFTSKMVIWGGGTCFSEEDGIGNYKYFTINRFLKKKYAYLAIGLGNLNKKNSLTKTRVLLENADFVSFRDKTSYVFAKSLCAHGNFYLTSDLSYLYEHNLKPKQIDVNCDVDYLLVSLRELSNFFDKEAIESRYNELTTFLGKIIQKENFKKVVFLPIDSKKDFLANKFVMDSLLANNQINVMVELLKIEDMFEKIQIILNSRLNITERLHSMVVSEINNKPCIGISYSPKIDRFYEMDLKRGNYIPNSEKVTKELLWAKYKVVCKYSSFFETNNCLKNVFNTAKTNIPILIEHLER
ncbi:polysaccharide pyruvyl transferase family protein [Flagellimonas sp.]|uniref:polysaccharide pyruvyl transferase family protein n=1 Tax=Flagellimonas sp. TaxID=2058762 RepID=UPI003B5125DF